MQAEYDTRGAGDAEGLAERAIWTGGSLGCAAFWDAGRCQGEERGSGGEYAEYYTFGELGDYCL